MFFRSDYPPHPMKIMNEGVGDRAPTSTTEDRLIDSPVPDSGLSKIIPARSHGRPGSLHC